MRIKSNESNIYYCHGIPGSSAEIDSLTTHDCIRPNILKPLDLKGFSDATSKNDREQVHVVGFSLGAMTALKIASKYPERVSKLILIAPAAPLELGEYLPKMAGRIVFENALRGGLYFSALTTAQRIGVLLAPNIVLRAMFSGSPTPDAQLLANLAFRKSLVSGLRSSFGPQRQLYSTAVNEYVKPWAHILKEVGCPVTIYHGVDDNWTPIEMSYALKKSIGSRVNIIVFEGLGHYSTLQKALPIACIK